MDISNIKDIAVWIKQTRNGDDFYSVKIDDEQYNVFVNPSNKYSKKPVINISRCEGNRQSAQQQQQQQPINDDNVPF